MKKIFKHTKDGIEVDISLAMPHGEEKEKSESKKKKYSYGAPDVNKHYFKTKEEAMKDAEKLGLKGIHSHKGENGETLYMAGPNHETFMRKHKEVLKEKESKKAKGMDMEDHKDMKEKNSEGYMLMKKDKKNKAEAEMIKDGQYMGKPPKKAKAGHYGDKKKAKAEMTPKQKGALDKNKDGKISKEDFEMLRKEKKESKSMHKDEDKDKKKKAKMSYAQILTDIASEKFNDGV